MSRKKVKYYETIFDISKGIETDTLAQRKWNIENPIHGVRKPKRRK